MAFMKLNIQLFADQAAGFAPERYTKLLNDYESELPNITNVFANNADAIALLKSVAGSPRLSEETRNIIEALNTSIEQTLVYFDSIRDWTQSVDDVFKSTLGRTIGNASSSVKGAVLDRIAETYKDGYVGVENLADIDNYVNSIQNEVIPKLRQALESITDSVATAYSALPAEIHANLTSTIRTNNSAIIDVYNQASQYLQTHLEDFKQQLQGAITSLADGARGH